MHEGEIIIGLVKDPRLIDYWDSVAPIWFSQDEENNLSITLG